MTKQPGPSVRRRSLGKRLRELRQGCGLTIADAAKAAGLNRVSIGRVETGRQAILPRTVRPLGRLYGLSDDETETLVKMAEESNQPGWWTTYSGILPNYFEVFLGLEEDAYELRIFQQALVPGLLQTADYIRAITLAWHPDKTKTELDRSVELRAERHERVMGKSPTRLHVVLDEGAVRRMVGGAAVMRSQIEHLIEWAQLPYVSLYVLPFDAGAHSAMSNDFTLMSLSEETGDTDLAYVEQHHGASYEEDREDVAMYEDVFADLVDRALGREETIRFLGRLVTELKQPGNEKG